MGNGNISKALGLLLLIPLSLVIGGWVFTNPTGAISGLSKVATIAIAFIALVNPKMGFYLLIPQVLYVDEIKRLAVYYGVASYETLYEVLLGPVITVAALNAGYLAGTIFGKFTLNKWYLYCLAGVLIIGGLSFGLGQGTVSSRGQNAINNTLYITIVPLMAMLFREPAETRKYLLTQIWWALPSAIWGIQQYYNGFSTLEIAYAKTGISPVHYAQVILVEEPRPFGFFGSSTGLGCVGIYGALALFYLKGPYRQKFLLFIAAVICIWTTFALTARSILIVIPCAIMLAFFFRSRWRTQLFYVVTIGGFVLAVANAERLMGQVNNINSAIESQAKWGSKVMNVNTFVDRLSGWARLTKSSSYSVFGTARENRGSGKGPVFGDADYSHDMINSVLINSGVVGLLISVIIAVVLLLKIHGAILSVKSPQLLRETSMLGGCVMTMVGLSVTTGGALHTNPLNLQIWSLVGAIIVIVSKEANSREVAPEMFSPGPMRNRRLERAAPV